MTTEIKADDWRTFCERFTRLLQGSPVDVALVDRDGSSRNVFSAVPLKAMSFRADGPCNDIIELRLGQPEQTGDVHTVIEPIHMKIREPREGRKLLEIDAESGTTLVHFHCGPFWKALADLQLEG
jgi:hypothetical protein